MPVHHNDLLDDPQQYDRQRSFTGGQVSYPRVNLLNEDQATVLQDVDLDSDLVISNRRGFRKWGDLKTLVTSATPQGIWWFDSVSYQFALVLAGGKLYRAPSSGVWTQVSATATPSTTALGYGAQVVDSFFLGTGDGKPKLWSSANIVASAAGTATTDGPSAMSVMAAQRYRLFGKTAFAIDEVYCSKFLPTDSTPFTAGSAIQPFRVGEGAGDPIVGMVPWKGLFSLVVVKTGSIWLCDTTPAALNASAAVVTSQFQIQQVGWLGSPAGRTVVRASNDVLFLAEDGVRSLARTIEDGDGKVSEPISWAITDWIERINWASIATANAVFHEGRYILAVPIDNSTTPNVLLVFNTRANSWVVWTGVQATGMVVASFNGQRRKLLILDARGHVLELRDHVVSPVATDFRDDVTGSDTRVPWRIRTRGLTWRDQEAPKHLDRAEFEFDRSEAIIDVDVHLDNDVDPKRLITKERTGYPGWVLAPEGGTPSTHPGSTLDCKLGEMKVKRIAKSMTHYGDAREIMFEVREASQMTTAEQAESGTLRMRSIQAAAYFETLEKET